MAQHSVVVIDSHDIARLGVEALVAQSPELLLAGSAATLADGLGLIRQLSPDLVIADMNLRDSTGLGTVRRVVGAQAPRSTLVMAANDENLFGEQVLMLGAGGYLMKDVGHAHVVHAAVSVASGGRWTSAELGTHLVNRALQERRGVGLGTAALTLREMEVLALLKTGKSTKQIAAALGISPRTVDLYRAAAKKKLRLRTAAELVAFASRHF